MVVGDHWPQGNLPDMTSLVSSGPLRNAIKYFTKVMRKTDPASQRVNYFGHYFTQTSHMFHITNMCADLVYGHTGYDVTSYFLSAFTEVRKTAEIAASDGFGSHFSGGAFCLPHQLVGILLKDFLAAFKSIAFCSERCFPTVVGFLFIQCQRAKII